MEKLKIDLTGKTAIVTGAGRGLGKCVALTLAECGADVWIGDISLENAQEAAKEIKALGRKSGAIKVDVIDYVQMKNLMDTVEQEAGKIDIMVNAAGIVITKTFLEITPEEVQKIMNINILSVSNGCQLALEKMMPRGYGRIINFSSTAGRRGNISLPHYAMTKAAVINLTQSAALTSAKSGVTVNAVCPGIIRTAMWEKILDNRASEPGAEREAAWQAALDANIPMGIAQEAIDIAWAVAFLCSDYARYIHGQSLNVCGGMRMN